MEEALYIGMKGDSLYIKAEGHVTAAGCPELKAVAVARLETSPPPRELVVDLGSCEYMDSTFLGLLAGLTKRMRQVADRPISLRGVNPTCLGLLKVIGVSRLVEISEEPPAAPPNLVRVGRGGRTTAEFLMAAHEELAALSPENRARFETLLGLLRAEPKEGGSAG